MGCRHPNPADVAWLFCRTCGVFEHGVRVGDATDRALREGLKPHEGKPVVLDPPLVVQAFEHNK